MTKHVPETWHLDAGQRVDLQVDKGTTDEPVKKRKFKMTAFTGAAVETLFGPVVFDLAGMSFPKNGKVPIFQQHDPTLIAGQSEEIDIDKKVSVRGDLFRNPTGSQVAELSDDGFAWQASLGLSAQKVDEVLSGDTVEVNGFKFEGPGLVVRKSRIREVSFVPLGADNKTKAVALDASTPVTVDKEELPMTTESAPKGATVAELKSAFPKDANFVLQCVEEGLTLLEAKAKYADVLEVKLQSRNKEIEELAAKKTAPEAPTTGSADDETIQSWQGSAINEWKRRVRLQEEKGRDRWTAIRQVAFEDPTLHQAYLDEHNLVGRVAE